MKETKKGTKKEFFKRHQLSIGLAIFIWIMDFLELTMVLIKDPDKVTEKSFKIMGIVFVIGLVAFAVFFVLECFLEYLLVKIEKTEKAKLQRKKERMFSDGPVKVYPKYRFIRDGVYYASLSENGDILVFIKDSENFIMQFDSLEVFQEYFFAVID